MNFKKLSIIVPAYNEGKTIGFMLDKVKNVKLLADIEKEFILVNDYSNDETDATIKNYINDNPSINIKYVTHLKNKGKGATIHTGIKMATGDYIIIQDSDMEYDPQEYNLLIKPILDGFADVVYGSRFMGGNPHRVLFFWHTIGNKLLTFLSNMFTKINLTDMETCYKLFDAGMLKSLHLKEQRFGFEPEVTGKISRIHKVRIYEVGISYYGRTYEEGKKINWKDGFQAIWCILKYNLWSKK
jgi:glycosyltransferase involved in cell wall biosynthesis